MDNKKLITIVNPDGTRKTVEYIRELVVEDKNYLIFTAELEKQDEYECNVVRIKDNNGIIEADEIKDDVEYQKVIKEVNKLLYS